VTAGAVGANLGGVALFALPGLALAELCAPLARLPLRRRLGYAFLLGVVAVAGALFAASHLFGVPLRRPAIIAAVLAPVALGLGAGIARRRRRGRQQRDLARPSPRPAPAPRGRRRRPWRLAATLTIVAVCLGTLASALSLPLADWDGRLTWSAHAAYMRHEGTVDTRVLRDAHWFAVNPRYPPLLPLAQVVVQETFGAGEDEQLFRALYVGFLASLLMVIYDGASRAAGAAAATLATLCAALIPFLSHGAAGATSAYSDLPLAAFYGAALVLLLMAPRSPASGLAAGLLLAGMVWTKSEGQLLAIVALLLAAVRLLASVRHVSSMRPAASVRPPASRLPLSSPRGRAISWRLLGWFAAAALPALAAVALLASWRAGIPDRFTSDYFSGLRLSALLQGAAARLPEIVSGVLRQTWRWPDWLGFWVVFAAVLLAGRRALARRLAGSLLLAGLAPAAIAWAAYAVATIGLGELIPETWSRFLLQGLAPLTIVFACALCDVMRQLLPPAELVASAAAVAPGAGAAAGPGDDAQWVMGLVVPTLLTGFFGPRQR
jgi:hypothetical protein